ADKEPQKKQEATLGEQVRLAGLVDQLGDLAHGAMHRKVAQLRVLRESEQQSQRADHQSPKQQPPASHPEEGGLVQIGQHERGFAARSMLGWGGVLQQSENHSGLSP